MNTVIVARTKPETIRAMQYVHRKPQDAAHALRWVRDGGGTAAFDPFTGAIILGTPVGNRRVLSGDYIIRNEKGAFHACQPSTFAHSYAVLYTV